jgi:hypothetical protein
VGAHDILILPFNSDTSISAGSFFYHYPELYINGRLFRFADKTANIYYPALKNIILWYPHYRDTAMIENLPPSAHVLLAAAGFKTTRKIAEYCRGRKVAFINLQNSILKL